MQGHGLDVQTLEDQLMRSSVKCDGPANVVSELAALSTSTHHNSLSPAASW